MKIVITGCSGLVGSDLWKSLETKHELWGLGRNKPEFIAPEYWRDLDIVDSDLTLRTIENLNPDCLIHSAAISNPDECESHPDLAAQVNGIGTRNLALACQKFDTEMLYISTDQVFDGKKDAPYTEMDRPNPGNVYGRSKLWGEEFVQTLLRRFYIVRTALVYGPRRPTFVDRVIQSSKTREKVTAATDIINTITYSKDLAESILFLIDKHTYGMTHIVNEGCCSRYELAHFIAKFLNANPDFIIQGIRETLALKAKRPGFSPLENFVWKLNQYPKLRSWQEALTNYIESKYTALR